jgi:thioredoxin-like negative regulator of GroEL
VRKRVFGLSLLAFFAASAPAQTVERGYPIGSLAVAAIERQDWATAERLLKQPSTISRDDPARLINLGRVYLATGRAELARDAFARAFASTRHGEVETLSGQIISTRELSRLALQRVAAEVQIASR